MPLPYNHPNNHVKVRTRDREVILLPDDVLDLGEVGMVVYLNPEEAKAYRILQAEHQRKVRQAVAFARAGREEGQ